ncbi:type I-E CRISPR-associated protein Cas6/Cse3/CasE [Halomonas almeriensis]|uniref:type I-E CRISPR-associated protein Cas6/Cse3/CasE n=1 Tax=Halomonas almeriensis TaxID=308163 RepID=UPI0025B4B167|nr:type I-E CRISPR-associated protein Cas6/Cse3/CasE [Halomonas almeriensis]MDN3554304.1 type I-E CRISPR-associated protein Cas6/Cse3/CasE [Halomonas almeriensis]
MYLSRVRVDLNGLSRGALFDIMDGRAYTAHQLLWRLFPDHQGARPFLFRQEMEEPEDGGAARGLPNFYVLSDREPEGIPGVLESQSKSFSPALEVGEQLAFRLRANPTVAKPVAGKRGRRADVLMAAKYPFESGGNRKNQACADAMDAAAREWLEKRAESWGVRLPVPPEVGGYRQHALPKNSGEPIRFSSIDYEGLLEVTDPGRLIETLSHGIGRAKAFGCGLLLLRHP